MPAPADALGGGASASLKNARTPGANNHPWTSAEILTLRTNATSGAAECARVLRRSVSSVTNAAHRMRISLRRKGSRSGSVLGQPRGVSLRRDVRDHLATHHLDELLAERMRIDEEAELCPNCGRRPVRVRTSGFCKSCHCRRLAELHREATDDEVAARAMWAARQARKASLDLMDAAHGRP